MNEQKNQQATEIIAKEISKLPANTPMDHGTLGAYNKLTKREGQAESMALYFVTRMYKIEFPAKCIDEWTAEEKQWYEVVKQMAAAAIAITGK